MNNKLKAIIEVIKGNAVVYNCELDMKLVKGMTIEKLNSAPTLSLEAHEAFETLSISLTRNKDLQLVAGRLRELP